MRAPLSLDTSPEIERRLIDAWRRMTSEEKAAVVTGLTRASLQMAMVGIRDRHPNDSPELQRRRLAELLHGPEVARRMFGGATANS